MKKLVLVLAAILAVALAAVPGAVARPDGATADPGVTSKSITIGATLPLSGPASLYARIGTGMRAYFSYINARRAAPTASAASTAVRSSSRSTTTSTRRPRRSSRRGAPVEQDRVFAMLGGLGTENQQAVRAYMNQRKVPQLYVSTGLSEFGRLYRAEPRGRSAGSRTTSRRASCSGATSAQNLPNAKVAVLRQNDDYGRELLQGFQNCRRRRSRRRHGDVSARRRRRRHRRSHGAPPGLRRRHVPHHRHADRDDHGARGRLPPRLAAEQARQLGRRDRHVHDGRARRPPARPTRSRASSRPAYLKDVTSPTYANDPQVKLYQRLMAKYAPGQPATDGLFFYGMAKADTFIQALYRAGRNPTRQNVMNAAANLKWKSPWLLPGSTINTSPGERVPDPLPEALALHERRVRGVRTARSRPGRRRFQGSDPGHGRGQTRSSSRRRRRGRLRRSWSRRARP